MHTNSETMYHNPPVVGYLENFERHCSKSYESNPPQETPVVVYSGERLEPFAKDPRSSWSQVASPEVLFANQDVYRTMTKQVLRIGMLLGSRQSDRFE